MKLRLPELKKELSEEDIKPFKFWEDNQYKIYPVIDGEIAVIELGDLTLQFKISNNEVGTLYGCVKFYETDYPSFNTLVLITDDYEYKTKSQLKSGYKKCRKELLKKYKEFVLQLFERK